MFQSYALWPHMTVFQNIVFGLDMKNQSSAEKEKRFEELEKLFQLKNLKNRYPSELSGGMPPTAKQVINRLDEVRSRVRYHG